jgi:hypothetical protein
LRFIANNPGFVILFFILLFIIAIQKRDFPKPGALPDCATLRINLVSYVVCMEHF